VIALALSIPSDIVSNRAFSLPGCLRECWFMLITEFARQVVCLLKKRGFSRV
jgi:hypothetical protein